MKKKIFLTGFHGYIGSRFLTLYGNIFTVINPRINICNQEEVIRSLSESGDPVVIHLAAKTHIDECEKEKRQGKDSDVWKVNVEGTKHIVDACKRTGSYLIMFSTECVFDGEKGEYVETDTPNPKNWYGETKYRAEQTVLESGIPACVLRSVYTYGHPDHPRDIVKRLVRKMKKKERIRAVSDQLMSFTFIDDLLRTLKCIINSQPVGILHYAGNTDISMYEFFRKAAAALGYAADAVFPITLKEYFAGSATLRLKNATLSSEKIRKLLQVTGSDIDAALASIRYNY